MLGNPATGTHSRRPYHETANRNFGRMQQPGRSGWSATMTSGPWRWLCILFVHCYVFCGLCVQACVHYFCSHLHEDYFSEEKFARLKCAAVQGALFGCSAPGELRTCSQASRLCVLLEISHSRKTRCALSNRFFWVCPATRGNIRHTFSLRQLLSEHIQHACTCSNLAPGTENVCREVCARATTIFNCCNMNAPSSFIDACYHPCQSGMQL